MEKYILVNNILCNIFLQKKLYARYLNVIGPNISKGYESIQQ